MKLTYQKFLKQGIDLSPLGMEKGTENETYFCTPQGAKIIGWAGVDGIHYCLVRGFGEMVFAVSPMNVAPHYIHPVARSFSDFLRLLLACGSGAALDQAWQWDAEQFSAFLADNPPTEEQKAVLAQIAEQCDLSPMENPWQYLHELQTGFDYSKIKYTEDFYDLDLNPDAPRQAPEWKVTFEGGFWGHSRERAGKELAIRREFNWGGHDWLIPSIYLCGRGVVVDFCMKVEPSEFQAFMEKWDLCPENEVERQFSQEQQMQLELDNPMRLDFCSILHVNGKELYQTHGCGTAYSPCLSPAYAAGDEVQRAMEHYGLDPNYGWVISRTSFPWATKRKPEIRSLSVTMIQDTVVCPGPHFQASRPGDTVTFSYSGQKHVLAVEEYETQVMDWSHMQETGIEYPSHYVAMSYTVTPEMPDGVLTITDCDDGDQPRQAPSAPGQPVATACAMVMGIMGSSMAADSEKKLHGACSSLYFEPVEHVTWRMVFYEKWFDDTTVDLLP